MVTSLYKYSLTNYQHSTKRDIKMIDTTELENQLNSPTSDKSEVIKNLVKSIDEIVLSNQEMKRLAEEAATLTENSLKEQKELFNSVLDLTTAIKNIFMVLNEDNPERIAELKKELAKWVLDSKQVKIGVLNG